MATRLETQETAEEQRQRLLAHKAETGESWATLSKKSGIADSTLSLFGGGNYAGNVQKVASEVRRYLDGLEALAAMQRGELNDPGYVETPTSRRLMHVLRWAHRGKCVAIACDPGTGKTSACREYTTVAANVFLATAAPSSGGVQPMQATVLRAMGDMDGKGTPQMLSARILERVAGANALIVIDEAQHLSEKAIDEARSWHDACGVGLALVGGKAVVERLSGLRRRELARLSSRISLRHIQAGPETRDAEIVARAWGITEAAQLKLLATVASQPGGLRQMVMCIELAGVLSAGDQRPVEVADLRAACQQLGIVVA